LLSSIINLSAGTAYICADWLWRSSKEIRWQGRRNLSFTWALNTPKSLRKSSRRTGRWTTSAMKERLRLLFQCVDRDRASKELTAWIREADSSGVKILKDAARKLLVWKPFILNWHEHRISTGKLEAINCKNSHKTGFVISVLRCSSIILDTSCCSIGFLRKSL